MPGRGLPPRESLVVKHILDYLRARGAFAEKVHGDSIQSALLDIIACYRGRFIHLEVKRDRNLTATPRQEYIIGKVIEAGGTSGVVYSVEQVEKILGDIDAGNGSNV